MNKRTVATLTAYILTIPAANLLITHLEPIPVGFGLYAPAGVAMVGIALILRDLVHEWADRWVVYAAIAAGAGLSYLLADPALAAASAAAFGLAELVDTAVYTPLRKRGLLLAVVASNLVGLVVDSVLFLHLAFGSLEYLPGQIVAKAEMTVLAAAVLWGLMRHRASRTPVLEPCDCTGSTLPCGHCAHDECADCGQCAALEHRHQCKALT